MTAELLKIERESCPAALFIGRKYQKPNWAEWWENGWFEVLEALPGLPVNDDGYIGATRKDEYWIGMFFPLNTPVPNGFEAAEMPAADYAVCYLYGSETGSELYSEETRQLCRKAMRESGFVPRTDGWCFERYNCPRFTTPDEHGKVILDYAVSVEGVNPSDT